MENELAKCRCNKCGFVEEFNDYYDGDVFMEEWEVNGCSECGSHDCEFEYEE